METMPARGALRYRALATTAALGFLVFAATGCLDESRNLDLGADPASAANANGEAWVEAWDSIAPPAVPTIDELEGALGLSDAQVAVVGDALETWRSKMDEKRSGRGRRGAGDRGDRPGHGVPGGFGDFEPPLLGFLEAVVPVLESTQVTALADLLEEKREDARPSFGSGGGRPRRGGRGGGPLGFVPRDVVAALDLSDQQRDELIEALRGSFETFHELRQSFAGGEITAEELRDQAKETREALEERVAEILSTTQFDALTKALAEHRAEIAQRRLDHLGEGIDRRVSFLATVLELSDAQRIEVESALEASVAERRAILEGLRDGTIEIEEALYRGYLIAEAAAETIRSVLTAEQASVFDDLRRLLPGHGHKGV
jgi:hypothetical protein